jgi:hypothetical protein
MAGAVWTSRLVMAAQRARAEEPLPAKAAAL